MHSQQADAAAEGIADGNDASDTHYDDDVMLAVPEAPRESLAQVVHYESPSIRAHMPKFQSIGTRQTFVPILLTVGTMLCLAGVVKLLVNEDSPLFALPAWVAYALFALGGGFVVIAILNMFQLRSLIHAKRAAKSAAAG